MAEVRALLPASLLLMVARDAKTLGVPMTVQIDDGEPMTVRPVDIETAGMAMFTKAMMKMTNRVIGRAVESGKLGVASRLAEGDKGPKVG
jgi:hypothetical protein